MGAGASSGYCGDDGVAGCERFFQDEGLEMLLARAFALA
jgi:hypothetical protein